MAQVSTTSAKAFRQGLGRCCGMVRNSIHDALMGTHLRVQPRVAACNLSLQMEKSGLRQGSNWLNCASYQQVSLFNDLIWRRSRNSWPST